MALQKSFRATWHSSINASTKSNRPKENPRRGLVGDAGQIFARERDTVRGSQLQLKK